MTDGVIAFLPAASVADHFGWWHPSHELLERIGPECEVKLRAGLAEEDGGVSVGLTRSIWFAVERRDGARLYGTVRPKDRGALVRSGRLTSEALAPGTRPRSRKLPGGAMPDRRIEP